MTKRNVGRMGRREPMSGARLQVRLPDELFEVLEAWARVEGPSTADQGRFLLQQAVEARRDRLAITRR